jgi:cyclin B
MQTGVSMSTLLQARSEASTAPHATGQQRAAGRRSPLPDIDAVDRANPLAAATYVNDIYKYYRRVEPLFRVPADYMARQVWRRDHGSCPAVC